MGVFNFRDFPVLETERLILCEIIQTDASAVLKIRGDYEVTRYNIGQAYTSVTQALDLIKGMTRRFNEGNELRWGITLRDENEVIGMVGFNYWHHWDHRASVGYDLARAHWGKGFMPEALRAVLCFGFERMELNRIEADVSAVNAASIRVLEKVGFRQEGVMREQYFEEGVYYDLLMYSILKREFV